MAIQKINPYIGITGGKGREAIAFYEKALDAKAGAVMSWDDAPMEMPAERKGLVMHAEINVGDLQIMLCDSPADMPFTAGGQVSIVLHLSDAAGMQKAFDALSEGGTVDCAPHDAFWGDKFAMLGDCYGVKWMLICPAK